MKNADGRERVHRLLDGGLAPAEHDELLRQVMQSPDERKVYAALRDQAEWLGQAGGLEPPRGFARQVMERLTGERPGVLARLRGFLFRPRSLSWNMASALAATAVLVIVSAVAVRQHPGGGTPDRTVTVRLNFYAPEAQRVSVAGDFNQWRTDAHALVRRDGGVWTADITLRPGTYSYMFVVDGRLWVTDPDAESFQDDGFGNRNAVVRVRT